MTKENLSLLFVTKFTFSPRNGGAKRGLSPSNIHDYLVEAQVGHGLQLLDAMRRSSCSTSDEWPDANNLVVFDELFVEFRVRDIGP